MKHITFKIINAGEGGVGKTTLLYRYVEDKFMFDTKMTIGVGFFHKTVTIDDTDYGLQLWDLGGEEHFRPFLNKYVDGANGAFLMFDLTRMATLNKVDQWVDIIHQGNPDCPIVFLGSKLDLQEQISVPDEMPKKLVEKHDFVEYIKVSSKTGHNVDYAFRRLVECIIESKM